SDLNAYRDGGHAACCGPASDGDMSPKDEEGAGCAPAPQAEESCCAPAPEAEACCVEESAASESCCAPAEESNAEACCAPEPDKAFHTTMDELLDTFDVNAYAASVKIFAVKPAS
ncbi:MAG: hypothetical protein P1V35_18010, partial [Planctomycetota bacterium]|nr:hypothetical protein [Planctomycetota bacterium]